MRLREFAGWSAPLLFANPRRQVFSRRCPFHMALTPMVNVNASHPKALEEATSNFAAAYVTLCRGYLATSHVRLTAFASAVKMMKHQVYVADGCLI